MSTITTNHPTGLAVVIAGAITVVLLRLGVELTEAESALLPVVIGVVVSAFSPRQATVVPAGGVGVGPDPEDVEKAA